MSKRYDLKNILLELKINFEIEGLPTPYFIDLRTIGDASANSLVFIGEERKDKEILARTTGACAILVSRDFPEIKELFHLKSIIRVSNPREVIAKIGQKLFLTRSLPGIHETAIIHANAKIHPSAHIGPHVTIGCSTVGENAIIYGNSFIFDRVHIGKNVIIGAGCVIGAEGFGYIQGEDGNWINFPHIGGVIIEDDVTIGSNTCIDRGSLGDTLIGCGAKVDNLVHIAHNVRIGQRALIIANAMIGGSSVIGDESWVSPSATIRDQVSIGSKSVVGLAAVVTKSVPDGETWLGSPARPIGEFKKLQESLKNSL